MPEPATVHERAPAKLNLRLEVGPAAADGYHAVRSLMVALDGLHDDVRVERAAARSVECPGVPERENLAWRALDALERAAGRPLPGRVVIAKRIPAQAGLGGGSSDAAAVLRAAVRLHGLPFTADDLERIAAEVGSDVPFFVRGGTRWATGRGDRLAPAPAVDFAAVLLMPDAALATPEVYARFDRLGPAAAPGPAGEAPPRGLPALAAWARNDLWPAALALAPGLGAPARALRAAGARRVLLCGSGACLAGLAGDVAEARAVAARLPGRRTHVVVPAPPSAR